MNNHNPSIEPTAVMRIGVHVQTLSWEGHIATRDLSIGGGAVARRLQLDRAAVNRAVRSVANAPDLPGTPD